MRGSAKGQHTISLPKIYTPLRDVSLAARSVGKLQCLGNSDLAECSSVIEGTRPFQSESKEKVETKAPMENPPVMAFQSHALNVYGPSSD